MSGPHVEDPTYTPAQTVPEIVSGGPFLNGGAAPYFREVGGRTLQIALSPGIVVLVPGMSEPGGEWRGGAFVFEPQHAEALAETLMRAATLARKQASNLDALRDAARDQGVTR